MTAKVVKTGFIELTSVSKIILIPFMLDIDLRGRIILKPLNACKFTDESARYSTQPKTTIRKSI